LIDSCGIDKICGIDDATLGIPTPTYVGTKKAKKKLTKKVVYNTSENVSSKPSIVVPMSLNKQPQHLHNNSNNAKSSTSKSVRFAPEQPRIQSRTTNSQRSTTTTTTTTKNNDTFDPFDADIDEFVPCVGSVADLCDPPVEQEHVVPTTKKQLLLYYSAYEKDDDVTSPTGVDDINHVLVHNEKQLRAPMITMMGARKLEGIFDQCLDDDDDNDNDENNVFLDGSPVHCQQDDQDGKVESTFKNTRPSAGCLEPDGIKVTPTGPLEPDGIKVTTSADEETKEIVPHVRVEPNNNVETGLEQQDGSDVCTTLDTASFQGNKTEDYEACIQYDNDNTEAAMAAAAATLVMEATVLESEAEKDNLSYIETPVSEIVEKGGMNDLESTTIHSMESNNIGIESALEGVSSSVVREDEDVKIALEEMVTSKEDIDTMPLNEEAVIIPDVIEAQESDFEATTPPPPPSSTSDKEGTAAATAAGNAVVSRSIEAVEGMKMDQETYSEPLPVQNDNRATHTLDAVVPLVNVDQEATLTSSSDEGIDSFVEETKDGQIKVSNKSDEGDELLHKLDAVSSVCEVEHEATVILVATEGIDFVVEENKEGNFEAVSESDEEEDVRLSLEVASHSISEVDQEAPVPLVPHEGIDLFVGENKEGNFEVVRESNDGEKVLDTIPLSRDDEFVMGSDEEIISSIVLTAPEESMKTESIPEVDLPVVLNAPLYHETVVTSDPPKDDGCVENTINTYEKVVTPNQGEIDSIDGLQTFTASLPTLAAPTDETAVEKLDAIECELVDHDKWRKMTFYDHVEDCELVAKNSSQSIPTTEEDWKMRVGVDQGLSGLFQPSQACKDDTMDVADASIPVVYSWQVDDGGVEVDQSLSELIQSIEAKTDDATGVSECVDPYNGNSMQDTMQVSHVIDILHQSCCSRFIESNEEKKDAAADDDDAAAAEDGIEDVVFALHDAQKLEEHTIINTEEADMYHQSLSLSIPSKEEKKDIEMDPTGYEVADCDTLDHESDITVIKETMKTPISKHLSGVKSTSGTNLEATDEYVQDANEGATTEVKRGTLTLDGVPSQAAEQASVQSSTKAEHADDSTMVSTIGEEEFESFGFSCLSFALTACFPEKDFEDELMTLDTDADVPLEIDSHQAEELTTEAIELTVSTIDCGVEQPTAGSETLCTEGPIEIIIPQVLARIKDESLTNVPIVTEELVTDEQDEAMTLDTDTDVPLEIDSHQAEKLITKAVELMVSTIDGGVEQPTAESETLCTEGPIEIFIHQVLARIKDEALTNVPVVTEEMVTDEQERAVFLEEATSPSEVVIEENQAVSEADFCHDDDESGNNVVVVETKACWCL
jgi:hypothetical protein